MATPRSPVGTLVYLFGGALIFIATLLLRQVVVRIACGDTQEPATIGFGAVVSVAGAIACAWLLYYALEAARRPVGDIGEARRGLHFAAGFIAALGLAAIGGTAIMGTLASRCPPV